MKKLRLYLLGSLLLAFASCIWLSSESSSREEVPLQQKPSLPSAPSVASSAAEGAAEAPEDGAAGGSGPTAEAGTLGMLEAHASLREPEVWNPDSESNRRAMEAMVLKALARNRQKESNP